MKHTGNFHIVLFLIRDCGGSSVSQDLGYGIAKGVFQEILWRKHEE